MRSDHVLEHASLFVVLFINNDAPVTVKSSMCRGHRAELVVMVVPIIVCEHIQNVL